KRSSTPTAASVPRRSRRRFMDAKRRPLEADIEALEEAVDLEARFGHWKPEALVELSIRRFAGGIAAISSFGADSAVLLDMIAGVDRALPILFLETGKHFGETLDYRDRLVDDLGLTDLRIVRPLESALSEDDSDGLLHGSDPDACCAIRKV